MRALGPLPGFVELFVVEDPENRSDEEQDDLVERPRHR